MFLVFSANRNRRLEFRVVHCPFISSFGLSPPLCTDPSARRRNLISSVIVARIYSRILPPGSLSKYVRSYGDRPNDLDSVSKCASHFSLSSGFPFLC